MGSRHPDVASSLNNLALLYQKLDRPTDAERLYKRALTVAERALGPDHPNVATSLNNLALLYETLGRVADATSLYKRVVAIREKAWGPSHPDVGHIAREPRLTL